MKQLIIFALGLVTLTTSAQDDKVWRVEVQFGNSGNISKHSGGMQTANARFNQNISQAPNINVVARDDFNKHWILMTGFGFNELALD